MYARLLILDIFPDLHVFQVMEHWQKHFKWELSWQMQRSLWIPLCHEAISVLDPNKL